MITAVVKQISTRTSARLKAQRAPARRVAFEDRLEDYTDPQEVKRSLERALEDVRRGRVHAKL